MSWVDEDADRGDFSGKVTRETFIVGEGMTQHSRTVETLTLPATRESFAEIVSTDPLKSLPEDKARWERELLIICGRENLEWTGRLVRPTVRKSEATSFRILGDVFSSEDGEKLPRPFEPHDGRGWYLARLLQLASRVESSLSRGHARDAVATAWGLGSLEAEMNWKRRAERDWRSGNKTRAGAKNGGHAKARANENRNKEIRAAFDELAASKSQPDTRAALVKRYGLDSRTIRRITGGK